MTKTINIKKFLGVGLFAALFAFIIFYTIFQTKSLAKGVEFDVTGITDGEVFEHDILSLTGRAVHANYITVNGREILVDEQEAFAEELVLSPGINIVTFEAKDKFNKRTSFEYRVFYKKDADTVAALKD